MKIVQVLVLIFLNYFLSIAQENRAFTCGTEYLEDIKQEMLKNREEFKNFKFQRGIVNYIPVRINLVALNDGTGGATIINALRMMCQMNLAYANMDLQFYIKDLRTINNTTIAETPRSSGGALQMQLNKDSKALNIYVTQKITDGVAGYYIGPPASTNDYLVVLKEYMADVRVAPHEVGHYLSLPHTFHGWDQEAWDPVKHGNPVNKIAPDGFTINEYADSSNCGVKNVGDGFCDTPADYNFGSNNCSYSLTAKDPNGKLVNPQTNNIMNYFFGCSKYIFTNQQRDAALASFNSSGRRDIRGTSPANINVITTAAKLVSPANGSSTVSPDTVFLDWEDVPGASSYLIQYDIVPTFEVLVESIVTKESKATIFKLTKNRTYHWRVIPYNDYSTCFVDPPRFTFKAGGLTSVQDIPEVKSFHMFPNPSHHGQLLTINLDNINPFLGTLTIYDIQGKLVYQGLKERYQSGFSNKQIDVAHLKAGIYSVVLASTQGISTKKLVVY